MSKLTVSTDDPNEIRMTRTFDAPRHLVVRAMREPELIKKWLGGVRAEVVLVDLDLRVGGRYRYLFRRPDGVEFALGGVYQEIADDRIVQTQAMEGAPGEAVVTTTWVERDGKTTMTIVLRFDSQGVRDAVAATGMAEGAGESYDLLEQLLATLSAA
jgi:uncharacterized protein YndB with AHSA1/START domain